MRFHNAFCCHQSSKYQTDHDPRATQVIVGVLLPIKGTASEVVGIDSATRFRNTVNDNRIVTPEKPHVHL